MNAAKTTKKATEVTLTFRVEADLKSEFFAAAQAADRSASLLLRDFMRDYVKHNKQHLPLAPGKSHPEK